MLRPSRSGWSGSDRGLGGRAAPARRLALFLVLLLPAFLASAALADGGYFPEPAFPSPPAIPAQRALIVHRNGIEDLVVESTLDAEGQAFGWVLPLPAKPTRIEATSAGVLDTLDAATGPQVIHDPAGGELRLWFWALAIFIAWTAIARVVLHRMGFTREAYGRVLMITMITFVSSILLCIGMPNLLAAKLGSAPGVDLADASETRRIGNYEVSVLEAKGADALDEWLLSKGLAAAPAAGRDIVASYVTEGWVFVVARLARDHGGLSAPHPLRATFPAKEPIYPMRLTAIAGGTTALRLHVVAGAPASAPGLEVRFRDRLSEPAVGSPGDLLSDTLWSRGADTRRLFAHPLFIPMIWGECSLTRLEGSLGPAAMARDILFRTAPAEPFVAVVYSRQGAYQTVLLVAIPVWMVAVFLLLLVPAGRFPVVRGWRLSLGRATLLVTVAACVWGGAVYGALPKVQVVTGWRAVPRYREERLLRQLREALESTDGRAGMPQDEAKALLEKASAWNKSRFLDGPVRWGDRPGEFQLLEDHTGPVLRLWTQAGPSADFAWFPARLEGIRSRFQSDFSHEGSRRPDPEDAREAMKTRFKEAGIRNPFTGAPIRFGQGPGDVEILTVESVGLVLRVHYREGKSEDLFLR